MKQLALVVLCVLTLFAIRCRKEEPPHSVTETTDTSTVTGESTDITITETTGADLFRETQGVRNANATLVTVAFDGMVTHVLGGGVTRAIVPRLDAAPPHPAHPRKLVMPGSVKTDFEAIFGTGTCPSSCEATIDAHAFRIVDLSGTPSSAFAPTFSFTDFIPHLSKVPSPDKPFENPSDLKNDVFAAGPVAGSVVAGFFELVGGVGDANSFKCGAKFHGETAYTSFAKRVQVFFDMPSGAKLQVLKAGQTDWALAPTITLSGPTFRIVIDNDLPNSNMSHFDRYIILSNKTAPGGGTIDLPDVEVDAATLLFCSFGGRPGCSNSQFP